MVMVLVLVLVLMDIFGTDRCHHGSWVEAREHHRLGRHCLQQWRLVSSSDGYHDLHQQDNNSKIMLMMVQAEEGKSMMLALTNITCRSVS